MAVGTVTMKHRWVNGNKKERIVEVVGSSSYTTGGDSLTAANLGLKTVHFASVSVKTGSAGWTGYYDVTNSKLVVYGDGANTGTTSTSAGAPQAASTTDLSGVTFVVRAVGI